MTTNYGEIDPRIADLKIAPIFDDCVPFEGELLEASVENVWIGSLRMIICSALGFLLSWIGFGVIDLIYEKRTGRRFFQP